MGELKNPVDIHQDLLKLHIGQKEEFTFHLIELLRYLLENGAWEPETYSAIAKVLDLWYMTQAPIQ